MPERVAISLALPGEPLRVEWELEELHRLGEVAERAGGPWRLEGDVDWGRVELLRVVSASFEDGSALALAAARPAGARGHGDEAIEAVLAAAGGDPEELAKALLSTEYGADGRARRIGLELVSDPDAAPMRVAADLRQAAAVEDDGSRRETASMELRMDGKRGTGLYEAVHGS